MTTYILYTTAPARTYQARADVIAAEWSKTKGRGPVEIIVKQVRPKKPKLVKDSDGDTIIDWTWFTTEFDVYPYEGAFFQFTPRQRKAWGITGSINGCRNRDNRDYPQFWLCCDAKAMAKGYTDLGEFERLMYHEHAHYDEDVDDMVGDNLSQDTVHQVDYELKQIDKYHLLVDYRGQALKHAVNKAVLAVIKFAKKYI